MALEKIVDKVIDTDVLVVGGGTAGCPLAGKASEYGLNVTVVEKANTARSGNVGHGVDSYGIFPNGITVKQLMELYSDKMSRAGNGPGRWIDPNIDFIQFTHEWWAVEEMERMGIPMRWGDGDYYWSPHFFEDKDLKLGLRVHWHNVKPIMAKMLKDRGIDVMNRVMIIDLLTNGDKVVGATAVDTRSGEFIVFKAKAVVLATGLITRIYEPEQPSPWIYKQRQHYCPASSSGDGYAMAFRAGAGIGHMDQGFGGIVLAEDHLCSVGNFNHNSGIPGKNLDWKGNDVNSYYINSYIGYEEADRKAMTPFYKTLEYLPDDFQKRLEFNYLDEWFGTLKFAEDRGFNPRNHRYEVMRNIPRKFLLNEGIIIDEECQSVYLKNLFAVGDAAAGIGGAIGAGTFGVVCGNLVHKYVSAGGEPSIDEGQVEGQRQTALAPLSVKDGTMPMEMEVTVRSIVMRYCGNFKSEGKLREGLRRLNSLKERYLHKLMAPNPHYLMRALEARNVLDLAEVHLKDCIERKETRGSYIRLDYPEMDDSLTNKMTVNRMVNGKPVLERRLVPEMKPEYANSPNMDKEMKDICL